MARDCFTCAKAQSSHGISASTSLCSTVGAGPDAQAGRRQAVGRDVLATFSASSSAAMRRGTSGRTLFGNASTSGSMILRQAEVLERVSGARATIPGPPLIAGLNKRASPADA